MKYRIFISEQPNTIPHSIGECDIVTVNEDLVYCFKNQGTDPVMIINKKWFAFAKLTPKPNTEL